MSKPDCDHKWERRDLTYVAQEEMKWGFWKVCAKCGDTRATLHSNPGNREPT